jgi:hypothetical protein
MRAARIDMTKPNEVELWTVYLWLSPDGKYQATLPVFAGWMTGAEAIPAVCDVLKCPTPTVSCVLTEASEHANAVRRAVEDMPPEKVR